MARDVSEVVIASYALVPSQAIGQINHGLPSVFKEPVVINQLLYPGRWRRM